ncbi:molybdate ABC transporter substrate-binding protein [Blautia schinkii]|uniref:molybdate ABC transporter substrate-binding protein n=1 Tax=Blautia schinkii TaxID=180164 RepID=UPI00156EC26B|nr:molybdate ABC transporter substrate-binding protein [Blautia schinkii]NSK34984.1 molybdate ABC transporter substrate-binding protein [Blautia schinkii]NSK65477.1 molybdate ABC transporter substrate-binding protein [Blautia schinkii]
MKKKILAAITSGVLTTGLMTGTVFAADTEVQGDKELKGEVYAFIAASLSNSMEEIQKDFNELYPNVTIYYSADSSGTLQTQIEEGARCDLFFSAADKQMDALTEEKLTKEDTVVDLLENKVVLIKPKDGKTKVTGFENVTDAENMALAGEDVPVGQYSREIFTNLGIMDKVNEMEINECKNVTDVLAAVSEGSNEIGVVYATDAASVADKVEILAEAPADSLQTPVLYPVGLIEDKEASEDDTKAAEAFLDYVESDAAIKVFEDYGFTAYEADDTDKDADESASQDTDSTEADKDSADSADSTSK